MKFFFLDCKNHESICNKDMSLDTLLNSDGIEISKMMSPLTMYYITELNAVLYKLLGITTLDARHQNLYNGTVFLNKDEIEYLDYRVHDFLNEYDSSMCKNDGEFCGDLYFMKTPPNEVILVVFKPGFVKHLMETKDNFLKFILECLRLLFKSNSDMSEFIKLYLTVSNTNIDMNYFKLRM